MMPKIYCFEEVGKENATHWGASGRPTLQGPKEFCPLEFQRLQKKRHEGISIVECLILVIVVTITLGAIMQTIAWSIGLQTFSREDIGIHIFVNNWFEALESLPPDVIGEGQNNLEDVNVKGGKIVDQVKDRMGQTVPYRYRAWRTGPIDGAYTVNLEVQTSSNKRGKLIASREVNVFSTATAPDNGKYD